jgi:hypothetical protein
VPVAPAFWRLQDLSSRYSWYSNSSLLDDDHVLVVVDLLREEPGVRLAVVLRVCFGINASLTQVTIVQAALWSSLCTDGVLYSCELLGYRWEWEGGVVVCRPSKVL